MDDCPIDFLTPIKISITLRFVLHTICERLPTRRYDADDSLQFPSQNG